MKATQIVASYLILQAVGVAAWWGLLLSVPASVSWFQPPAWPPEALLGFFLGDAMVLIGGSIATSVMVLRRSESASIAVWSLTLAVWYPTLYCIGVSLLTDEAWLAAATMACMAGLTLAVATIYGAGVQEPATFRVTPMNKQAALAWTIGQTVIFWGALLWILPKAIVEVETRIGWPSFSHPYQTLGAIVLFMGASALGFVSAVTMAWRGDGTPLPTATAPKLVVSGPYRWVRNPMAVAGIAQGIAVGWYFGSYTVIGYAISGAFVWHCLVRPSEEADLAERFGDSYRLYKGSVWLWVPRRPGQKSD